MLILTACDIILFKSFRSRLKTSHGVKLLKERVIFKQPSFILRMCAECIMLLQSAWRPAACFWSVSNFEIKWNARFHILAEKISAVVVWVDEVL